MLSGSSIHEGNRALGRLGADEVRWLAASVPYGVTIDGFVHPSFNSVSAVFMIGFIASLISFSAY
jgi:hypothetical protein